MVPPPVYHTQYSVVVNGQQSAHALSVIESSSGSVENLEDEKFQSRIHGPQYCKRFLIAWCPTGTRRSIFLDYQEDYSSDCNLVQYSFLSLV